MKQNTPQYKLSLLILLLSLTSSFSVYAQLHINEIVSANNLSLIDEDGDSSDWIELFNAGTTAIDLTNYRLSDQENINNAWVFPAINLEANEYLIIFASDKNRSILGHELHTDFKISANGETLYLWDANSILIQELHIPSLAIDESYAAYPNGSNNFSNTSLLSPNHRNNVNVVLFFSKPRGFYAEEFLLSINSSFSEHIEIRYTLNGQAPTMTDALYEEAIPIKNRTASPNYFSEFQTTPIYPDDDNEPHYSEWATLNFDNTKGLVLKAAAFKNGERVSKIYTHSYFIFEEQADRFSLPVVSLSLEEADLFNDTTGIYVPGLNLDHSNLGWTGNYYESGSTWERPAFIEYFVNGQAVIQQTVGARIHGGKTRSAAQKSLKLYARSEYGNKYLEYPFFKNKEQVEYKRIILRTSMASWNELLFDDAFIHQLTKNLNFDIQEYQPVIVFLNGEYWGIHTLREKIDEHKYAADYNIDADSISIHSSYGTIISGLMAGENDFYNFRDGFMANFDPENPSDYEYVKSQIDVDNLIDYYITELFINNRDWPGNNSKMWRSPSYDQRWHWIFYDTDGGFGYDQLKTPALKYLFDSEDEYYHSPLWATSIIRKLIKNETFKNQFLERMQDLLTSTFAPQNSLPLIYQIKDEYLAEMEEHTQRWSNWVHYQEWEYNVARELIYFMQERPCVMHQQMIDVFGVEPFMDCNDDYKDLEVKIFPNPNNGNFTLKVATAEHLVYPYSIWNDIGQKVHFDYIEAGIETPMYLEHLPKGMYFIQINTENKTITKKVIIH